VAKKPIDKFSSWSYNKDTPRGEEPQKKNERN
jgi:hypothetical protein